MRMRRGTQFPRGSRMGQRWQQVQKVSKLSTLRWLRGRQHRGADAQRLGVEYGVHVGLLEGGMAAGGVGEADGKLLEVRHCRRSQLPLEVSTALP